jgi:hypothetical protein
MLYTSTFPTGIMPAVSDVDGVATREIIMALMQKKTAKGGMACDTKQGVAVVANVGNPKGFQ